MSLHLSVIEAVRGGIRCLPFQRVQEPIQPFVVLQALKKAHLVDLSARVSLKYCGFCSICHHLSEQQSSANAGLGCRRGNGQPDCRVAQQSQA